MDGVRINKVSGFQGWIQDKQGFQWMESGYTRVQRDGVRINKVSKGRSQDKQGFQWMESGYTRFPS